MLFIPVSDVHVFLAEECQECSHHEPALKERPMEVVAARLAQQDQAEQDTLASKCTSPTYTLAQAHLFYTLYHIRMNNMEVHCAQNNDSI